MSKKDRKDGLTFTCGGRQKLGPLLRAPVLGLLSPLLLPWCSLHVGPVHNEGLRPRLLPSLLPPFVDGRAGGAWLHVLHLTHGLLRPERSQVRAL